MTFETTIWNFTNAPDLLDQVTGCKDPYSVLHGKGIDRPNMGAWTNLILKTKKQNVVI